MSMKVSEFSCVKTNAALIRAPIVAETRDRRKGIKP
jgi:hypothetical protein